jgi:hypothetical protein
MSTRKRRSRLHRRYGRMTQMPLPFNRSITNVLGESRQIEKVYPGGEYNCPFCGAAAKASGCENPACSASTHAMSHAAETRPYFEKAQREHESRLAEEADRRAAHESAMRRGEEYRQEQSQRRQEVLGEAIRKGACQNCALDSLRVGGKVKFVKHRGACPKAGR